MLNIAYMIYLPGLRRPFGSKRVLIFFIRSIAVSSREYRIYGAFIRPSPCSAEMDPLFSARVGQYLCMIDRGAMRG
jgi:hypothetical protein